MNPAQHKQFITLKEAAEKLQVPVTALLTWNEFHILKPTISQTGEIGYTQEQIDQFLIIQESFRGDRTHLKDAQVATTALVEISKSNLDEALVQDFIQKDTRSTTETPQDYIKDEHFSPVNYHNNKHHYQSFTAPFFAMLIVFIIFVIAGQGKLMSLFNLQKDEYQDQPKNSMGVLGTKTSKLRLTQPMNLSVKLQDGTTRNKTLGNADTGIFTDKIANFFSVKNAEKVDTTISQYSKGKTSSAVKIANLPKEQADIESNITKDMNDASTLASITSLSDSKTTSEEDAAIDENGNITGKDSKTDTIAMIIGGSGGIGSSTLQQPNSDLQHQLILLSVFSLGVAWLMLKKPKETRLKTPVAHHQATEKKIFELDQKMDGTVVVYFQGNMYKISKPELYSDSDRFIERLMTLSQPDIKEMDYDSSKDETIQITTPLSRLVTRLGFVGIKRDLFFPRTSKNRVLFRRYVTEQDLTAMNLTLSQISRDLLLQAS